MHCRTNPCGKLAAARNAVASDTGCAGQYTSSVRPHGPLSKNACLALRGNIWVLPHLRKAAKQPCHRFRYLLCARPCRFLNGMKAQGTPLGEAKVVFYGAGSSAVGVASMIARLIELDAKISPEDARKVRHPLCHT